MSGIKRSANRGTHFAVRHRPTNNRPNYSEVCSQSPFLQKYGTPRPRQYPEMFLESHGRLPRAHALLLLDGVENYLEAASPAADVEFVRLIKQQLPDQPEITVQDMLGVISRAIGAVNPAERPAALSVANDVYMRMFQMRAPKEELSNLFYADGIAVRDTRAERSVQETAMLGSLALGNSR